MPSQLEVNENICDGNETPRYQNTYRMEPRNPFKSDLVDKIVRSVMNNRLDEIVYDDGEIAKLCGDIASEIRRRVKKLNFDRHKTVVVVTIIEKGSQTIEATLGFLWDGERDHYSTFSFEGRTFHAQCCVFGLYYEWILITKNPENPYDLNFAPRGILRFSSGFSRRHRIKTGRNTKLTLVEKLIAKIIGLSHRLLQPEEA